MTKDFQQELLEKVKPGMKPSDIKKQVKEEAKTLQSPSPIVQKDDGYESDQSDKSIPVAPPLPNQNLLNQITSLKKQLQLYKDFRESDMKIKEKLQEENKLLKEKVSQLANPAKPEKKATKTQSTQTEKTFTLKNYSCQICFEERKGGIPSQLLRVKGLGGERNKKIWVCFLCRKKVVVIHDEEENWRNF